MLNRDEAEKRGLVVAGGYGWDRRDLRELVGNIEKKGFKAYIVWCPFKPGNLYDEESIGGHELVYTEPAYLLSEDLERIKRNLKSCEQRRSSLTKAYSLAMVELDKEEDDLFKEKDETIEKLTRLKEDEGKK